MNIVEYIRKEAVSNLFNMSTFSNSWPVWQPVISTHIGLPLNPTSILNIGDDLASIFQTTSTPGRTQNSLSGGGAAWEGLVCWYLNLCLIGTRSVVIKQDRKLIPQPLRDAFTVNYGNVPSNTESDLVGITFPDLPEYTSPYTTLSIPGLNLFTRQGKFKYLEAANFLCDRDFNNIEAYIIQCKTNWNDNAQIPMLWDMIYASRGFSNTTITVGANNYQINALKRFAYAFITVPSNTRANYTHSSMAVKRVVNLSGGNYWGKPTQPSIAASIQDFFMRNCANSTSIGFRASLQNNISRMNTDYSYFRL
jgi:hypothetical protein